MKQVLRTPDQIISRIEEVTESDFLGKRREVLIFSLDYDDALPYLKDGISPEDWTGGRDKAWKDAREYLDFAISKAVGHRGLSASRSVDAYREWMWLMSEDTSRFEEQDYQNYGLPMIRFAAHALGLPWDSLTHPVAERMADGLPCEDGCEDGCS